MNIRLMQIKDYPLVHQLWLNTPGMGLTDKDDSEIGIQKFLDRNPQTCFVATEEGQIIGTILSGHDGRRGFIYHLAVSQMARHKGIGTALIDAVIDAMTAEGIHKIALLTFSKNDIANHFWQQYGFEERADLTYRNKEISKLTRIDT